MYAVNHEIETIHLYVVREEEKNQPFLLPLLAALLCLLGIGAITLYSAMHPSYEQQRLSIPAHFLPLKTFAAQVPIIPTGKRTYSATYAEGTLTLTNGSVLSEVLPQGIIFSGANGVEVQTEQSVFIPAGSAIGYGVATVPTKAVVAGKAGNIQTLAINAVYGMALYVRNLSAFTGGKDAYSVSVQLPQDRQTALTTARALVVSQKASIQAMLASPCKEIASASEKVLRLSWGCQFVTYHVPSHMHVTAVQLVGRKILVDVVFVPQPQKLIIR